MSPPIIQHDLENPKHDTSETKDTADKPQLLREKDANLKKIILNIIQDELTKCNINSSNEFLKPSTLILSLNPRVNPSGSLLIAPFQENDQFEENHFLLHILDFTNELVNSRIRHTPLVSHSVDQTFVFSIGKTDVFFNFFNLLAQIVLGLIGFTCWCLCWILLTRLA